MIKSFKCKDTEDLFDRKFIKKFPADITRTAQRKLAMLDAAIQLSDLKIPPNNRLEKLQGDRKGQWSIRINRQWRVCFTWKEGRAHQVEITKHYE